MMPLVHVYKGRCDGKLLIPKVMHWEGMLKSFVRNFYSCGRQQIVDLFFLNENCLHYFKNLTRNFDFIEKTT